MTVLGARFDSVFATAGSPAWTNTPNFVDGAYGSTPTTIAAWASTVSGGVGSFDLRGVDDIFAAIPAGSTINSVTVSIRHTTSNNTRMSGITIGLFDGATQIGTNQNSVMPGSATIESFTFPATLAQLKSATFTVRGTCTRGANTSSSTWSVDHVDIAVDYTAPVTGGLIKYWNGSAWVDKPMKYWNGSTWVQKPVKVWDGSAWVLS